MEKKQISVILPIRITPFRKDILERLTLCYRKEATNIEYVVVDDGSLPSCARDLQHKCKELGYKYVSTGISNDRMFNLARARNIGAKVASGTYVLFLDVDLLVYPGFYSDIMIEAELQDMLHNSDVFLMFPVIYLTNEGMQFYAGYKENLKKHVASQIMIEGKHDLIEKYSYGTSAILVNRLYYLTIGGQDERFEGWGYEDYDFTIKMMKLSSQFLTPVNYSSMKGNFMTIKRYSGWKAEYRLYGMWMARKGIYLYHAPHEVDTVYKKNQNVNLALLQKSLQHDYSNTEIQTIEPNSARSLLLSKNPFCCDYKLNPIMGKYEVLDIKKVSSWRQVVAYFTDNGFTQIVMPNPYGNSILLDLYNYCRANHLKYIVCERGALPDSIYHDTKGFLYDSCSYSPDKWDVALTKEQRVNIKEYLVSLKNGSDALEQQPLRLLHDDILAQLGIKNKIKKRILIVLQTKNDTVIKFFGRHFINPQAFIDFIENVISMSNDRYHFVYKNHPLELDKAIIDGAINADAYHINDLIGICDSVLTINSGVGLIAALLQKPVFTVGDSWYSMDGIACNINDEADFLSKIDGFQPSSEKLLRFAYYLRYNFYSFGKQHTKIHRKTDTIINATLKIDYTEVQIPNRKRVFYRNKTRKIGFNSSLFKEYEEDSLKQNMKHCFVKKQIQKRFEKVKRVKVKVKVKGMINNVIGRSIKL